MIRGNSHLGGIIILLKKVPIRDPVYAWKQTLCQKDTAKGNKSP